LRTTIPGLLKFGFPAPKGSFGCNIGLLAEKFESFTIGLMPNYCYFISGLPYPSGASLDGDTKELD
jgi:hypothetical protein